MLVLICCALPRERFIVLLVTLVTLGWVGHPIAAGVAGGGRGGFNLGGGWVVGATASKVTLLLNEKAHVQIGVVGTLLLTGSVLVSILSSASSQRRNRSCWPPCLALVLVGWHRGKHILYSSSASKSLWGPSPLSINFQ